MTIRHYSPLFETVRHYSHYLRLSALFGTIRYSQLFAIRYSGFPDTRQWRQTILVIFCKSGSVPNFVNIFTKFNPSRGI